MTPTETIKKSVQDNLDTYMAEIVQPLYDNPEIGNEEFETMELLTNYLIAQGFETKKGYVVPTGFIGEYQTGKPGPTIAFMCEFDALPEVGHGCGHNIIAATGIAAGVALKEVMDQFGGTLQVIGTPAEENFGGKVSMANAGVFDNVDVALMSHPGVKNGVGSRSLALYPVKFEFFGQTAHGCHPEMGASALDAAVMSFLQINVMRQFIKTGSFIHGIVKNGGEAANVIPGYASLEYYFRATTISYAKEMAAKAEKAVAGICEANGVTFKSSVYECPYEDTVINYKLAEMLTEKFNELGAPDVHSIGEIPLGSTDVGAVSYKCPTIQGGTQIAGPEVGGHTKAMASATLTPLGKTGLYYAATGIALVALDLLENPEKLAAVKKEFDDTIATLA